MKQITKKSRKSLIFLLLSLTVLAIWGYRFIKINSEWPPTVITKIPFNESYEMDGVEYTVLQSVIAPPKMALEHYGLPNADITDDQLNPMYNFGWECKVLAVQLKLKNCTDAPMSMTNNLIESAETTSWSNGLSSPNLKFFNPNNGKKLIEPQGELIIIYPYYLYPNHFNASDWAAIDKKRFYLVANKLYPEKIEFDCSAIFL